MSWGPGIVPSVVICLEIERTEPVVRFFTMTQGEERRLFDWLESQPELWELIRHACRLGDGFIQGPPGAANREAA